MRHNVSGRKVANAREASELLEAWARSGERLSSWCSQRGINWYSLSAYKGWSGEPCDGFVEVETTALVRRTAPSSSRYRVVLGDRTVEVGADFDDDVLGRLVRVLESC